jgi:hypothetical protein
MGGIKVELSVPQVRSISPQANRMRCFATPSTCRSELSRNCERQAHWADNLTVIPPSVHVEVLREGMRQPHTTVDAQFAAGLSPRSSPVPGI